MPLTRWINNLKNLKQNLENDLNNIIPKFFNDLEKLERDRLSQGMTADGTVLMRKGSNYYPYSQMYVPMKRRRGGQVRVVDLKLTGAFHRGITATKIGRNKVQIYSRDSKDAKLNEKYDGIHGFSDKNKQEDIPRMFEPEIIISVERNLTKK
jgi:hypothetical protein